ncbi:flagellar biosynthesis regulator FlaF [Chachezhania sediminis]|uniref:flagellar biosynthesis regulator FlaF n=1 Tax=Chachezhania sediminis TaxID=2599291 RepID=UPI00131B9C59|nr:flagellar biosynthesis regulator FlaF [Chachezhania sediminis]
MNAQNLAQRGYTKAAASTRTPRGIEYEALARITHRLRQADAQGSNNFPKLAQALHDNGKLWDLFAIDVADPGNNLPADLRARIFYLAEFTREHTSKVLARKANITPLLDINTAIMRGLRGDLTPPEPAQEHRPQQAAQPVRVKARAQHPGTPPRSKQMKRTAGQRPAAAAGPAVRKGPAPHPGPAKGPRRQSGDRT